MTGLYVPGTSLVHRAPAGWKLLALAVLVTVVGLVRTPLVVGVGTVVVLAAYVLSGLLHLLPAQVAPLRWFVLLLVPVQWWMGGWRAVVVVLGTMLVAVAAAGLVTLTTRVSDVLDVVQRVLAPLRRVGVDPERVGLVLALTLRAIPVVHQTYAEARDARRARGLERSTRALVVPLVVRTVRHADRVGEALAARGVDD